MLKRLSVNLVAAAALGLVWPTTVSAAQVVSNDVVDMIVDDKRATAKRMGKGDICPSILTITADSFTAEQTGIFFRQRWFNQGEWTCWSMHHEFGRRYKRIMVKQTTYDPSTGQVIRVKDRIFRDAYSVWGVAKINRNIVDIEIWADRNGDFDFEGYYITRLNGNRYPTA